MKRFKHNFKKGMAFVLSLAMVAGLVPAMSGGANTVQAATGSGTEPSVTAYATKDQLMNSFKPNSDGTAANYGKLVFGKNSSGTAQQWYILGKDTGVTGDNTIIFAASPIATGQVFENDWQNNKTDTSLWNDCDYNGVSISEVYPNHYGASDLRAALKAMASNTTYFTTAEQGLMNATTVTTKDTKNKDGSDQYLTYTTTDKLYALQGDYDNDKKLWAGTSDSTVLAMNSYWSSGAWFWLRSPYDDDGDLALFAFPGIFVNNDYVNYEFAVQPASNLNLSSVLFASAATAASSDTAESYTIASEAAMTLRLDGTGKDIGTVTYNTTTGDIKAVKGSTSQTVALVVQGNDGTNNWYYSKQITATETINVSAIESESNTPASIDLSTCKIWLEITEDNVSYAVDATEIVSITSVAITGIDTPVANTTLDTSASCTTTGVSSTAPQITWTPSDSIAGYNTSYKASITLTADTGYEFADNVTATVLGYTATSVTKNADGTLTVTYDFPETAKRKITGVTAPTVPANNTFTTYYGYDGYTATPISESNTELGKTATVTFEGTTSQTTAAMAVKWTIESAGGGYDRTPGATNTFRWTILESELSNYNAADCQGYDTNTGNITGTVTITNKAATPVSITGTDSSIEYTGATVDVSRYFSIDTNAGTATYSLVTGTNGGTGEGTLNGTTLTVTKTGTFKIKVETLANGIYASGEETITLTVDNGTIEYSATDYSGTYDGQPHSISVNVSNPADTTVTYSTDGTTYGSENPSFTNEGTYTVYYRIMKDNYDTIDASKTVTINKKPVNITAENQDIVWGNDIDQGKYTKDGLVTGDSITEITLTASTTALTENGTISISGVKIVNASDVDMTGNYDITTVNGILKIAHDTTLAMDRIEAVKTKTSYIAGDILNVDDLTVTAYYADGYSEVITGYTTNVSDINMSTIGNKTLTVSYTKDGVTKTDDISITVNAVPVTEYTITASAGANGSISPSGAVSVEEGGSKTFTISPSSGYVIDTLKVDGMEVTATTSYTFSDVNANHTIEVTFKQESQTPDVTEPSITTQPDNATVKVGETATFTIAASGTDLTYQWQIDRNDGNGWVNIVGATATSYTTSTVNISCNGFKYQCVVSNAAGTVTSNTAVLTVTENTTPDPEPVDYEILDGANSNWEQNSDGILSIRGSGEFSKFVGVKVDGNLVDAKNYTVKEGSTIVTLKAEYLNTLSVGSHTIEIVWTDGTASTTFTIKAASSDNGNNNQNDNNNSNPDDSDKKEEAPKTGDDTPVVWLFILSIISGTGLILIAKKRRENLEISEK